MNTRALASRILVNVNIQGASLTDALAKHQSSLSNIKDQGLLQELCFGVTRWWWRLDAIVTLLLDKPLKTKDSDIKHLLMIGLYQLQYMRVPDHAAVAETVAACLALKKAWAKNLVNAILRNYQRRTDQIALQLKDDPVAEYSHPQWLLETIKAAWPQQWQSVLQANNEKPPMVLRVNLRKITRTAYLEQLMAAGMSADELCFSESGLSLQVPVSVDQLPGFADGLVSVQDAAPQLAASLLQTAPKQRVLDVCAAPGGKTAHILESQPDLQELVAIDIDSERLDKVADNLQRLDLNAKLIVGDGQAPETWWDNREFDRILLDAPCSATGVIRRHPDIKQLRRASDIQQLVDIQQHILRAVWPLLRSGGIILYATCSILPQENEQQVREFLGAYPDAITVKIPGAWGISQEYGRQILPGQNGMDGFYYACIQKQ
ncbi:16S rRNA (cytosine(967)-C(5))-methyltransferase RsmB [Kaarinaea lacus]